MPKRQITIGRVLRLYPHAYKRRLCIAVLGRPSINMSLPLWLARRLHTWLGEVIEEMGFEKGEEDEA